MPAATSPCTPRTATAYRKTDQRRCFTLQVRIYGHVWRSGTFLLRYQVRAVEQTSSRKCAHLLACDVGGGATRNRGVKRMPTDPIPLGDPASF